MQNIYYIVATIVGWIFLSNLQRKSSIVIFAAIDKYIVAKVILSLIIGIFITPFYLIYIILKALLSSKSSVQ